MPFWLDVIIQLVAGTGGAAGLAVASRKIIDWWRDRRHRNTFRMVNKTYLALQTLMNECGAKRAVVLKAENNGGIPMPGCQIFSTAVYEVWQMPLRSIRDEWQRQILDAPYCGIIQRILENGRLTLRLPEMPEGSHLKQLYQSNGVERSEIFKLGSTSTAIWYLSLNFSEDFDLENRHENTIRAAVTALKHCLGFERLL